jgi:hypothetical protein
MPTVYKRCGQSLNVNEISRGGGRHAAVRLVYNEVGLQMNKVQATPCLAASVAISVGLIVWGAEAFI